MRVTHLLYFVTAIAVAAPVSDHSNNPQHNRISLSNEEVPTLTQPHVDWHQQAPERRSAIRNRPATKTAGFDSARQNGSGKPTKLQPETDFPSIGKNLTPYVKDFHMAHNLKMASKGERVRKVSFDSLLNAEIPEALRFIEGNFEARGLPEPLYLIDDDKRFDSATLDLTNAKSKSQRIRLNSQYGELAVQSITGANLFDPANSVLSAVTGSDTALVWKCIGSGIADPVPDVLLNVDGRKAAVIEIKTTTALDATKIKNIMDDYPTYVTQQRVDNGTTTFGIYRPPQQNKRRRENTSVQSMEQLVAQMYAHKVDIGALTTLDTWIILEKTKDDVIEVTKLDGVVDGKSRALDIVLAMTDKVAHNAILNHRPRV